jgi:glycosyltransferase involved in cell wall biosynthesis
VFVCTLVIIPTYNEAPNVLGLARDVLEQDSSLEVLVVDDASPDGTGDLVENAMRSQPRLHLLRRAGKFGLGSAYLAGFRYGIERGFEQIFSMDGDRSHDPAHLPHLLADLEHHDMVIGSRYIQGGGVANWRWDRRVLSRFANWYVRVLLRLPLHDCTSGYRGYRREVLEHVDPFSVRGSGYSFLEEMVWRVHKAGFRIGEVPIIFTDRSAGVSKIDQTEILKAAWHVLATALRPPAVAERSARPLKQATSKTFPA